MSDAPTWFGWVDATRSTSSGPKRSSKETPSYHDGYADSAVDGIGPPGRISGIFVTSAKSFNVCSDPAVIDLLQRPVDLTGSPCVKPVVGPILIHAEGRRKKMR